MSLRLMAPLRVVALSFLLVTVIAGGIRADADPLSVKLMLLQRRLELLETAFAPKTYREVVEKWAEGVKSRNGAVQFAVLSPELRDQLQHQFEELMWVTGTSSPWVEQYSITSEQDLGETTRRFAVQFQLATSTCPAGEHTVELVVSKSSDQYYISKITTAIDGLFPH